jgi:hypothetical protein
MIYAQIFEWSIRITAVLAVIMAGWGVYRITRYPRRFSEPRCAKCHYIVKRLPNERCPECGADLSAGGVLLPGASQLSGARIWGWSILCLLLGIAGSQVNLVFGVYAEEEYSQGWIRGSQDIVHINAKARLWNGSAHFDQLTCQFDPPGSGSFEWFPDRREWHIRDASGTERVSPAISSADIALCTGPLALTPPEIDLLRDHLQKVAATSDPTDLKVFRSMRPPGVPWDVPFLAPNTGGFGGGYDYIGTASFFPWICLMLWGTLLPVVGQGSQRMVKGREAQLYLRVDHILEKSA